MAAEHRGETITYGRLDREANRPAAILARYGVRPGDNVALFVRRGIPMLVAGRIPVPAGHVSIAIDDVMRRSLGDQHEAFEVSGPVGPHQGCYVLFTSGTTGRPNGVTVTHRNVCNLLLTAPGDLGIRPGRGWRRSSTSRSTWPPGRCSER